MLKGFRSRLFLARLKHLFAKLHIFFQTTALPIIWLEVADTTLPIRKVVFEIGSVDVFRIGRGDKHA